MPGRPGQDQRADGREGQPEDDDRVLGLDKAGESVPSHIAEPGEDQPEPHDAGRHCGHGPTGPGLRRDAHSIIVAAPRPVGNAHNVHTTAGTASAGADGATREVRWTPSRMLASRIHSRQNRKGSGLAAKTCTPVAAVKTTAAEPTTTPPQPRMRPTVRVARQAAPAKATKIPI